MVDLIKHDVEEFIDQLISIPQYISNYYSVNVEYYILAYILSSKYRKTKANETINRRYRT